MPDATPTSAPPKRRWYQYSLRTMFVVVTLLAIPCWYVGEQWRIVAHRKAMQEWIRAHGGLCGAWLDETRRPTMLRRLLGDKPTYEIWLPACDADNVEEIKSLFPESRVSLGGSPPIYD